MALFRKDRSTPPATELTPVALPLMAEALMRTKELAPLETTPFWKLLLMVLRSTIRRIRAPDTELIPLPRLFASVLSRTVMVTAPEVLFAFTPSELAVTLLLLMTATALPPTAGCTKIPPPVEGAMPLTVTSLLLT